MVNNKLSKADPFQVELSKITKRTLVCNKLFAVKFVSLNKVSIHLLSYLLINKTLILHLHLSQTLVLFPFFFSELLDMIIHLNLLLIEKLILRGQALLPSLFMHTIPFDLFFFVLINSSL